jgi:hypothetical protein
MYGNQEFPSVVWLVIYAGLFITVGFSYFFGLETFPSQALMCGIFSSLLGLTILAILELAHPYQGAVVVSDVPFKFAIARMDLMDKIAFSEITDQSQFALSAGPHTSFRKKCIYCRSEPGEAGQDLTLSPSREISIIPAESRRSFANKSSPPMSVMLSTTSTYSEVLPQPFIESYDSRSR